MSLLRPGVIKQTNKPTININILTLLNVCVSQNLTPYRALAWATQCPYKNMRTRDSLLPGLKKIWNGIYKVWGWGWLNPDLHAETHAHYTWHTSYHSKYTLTLKVLNFWKFTWKWSEWISGRYCNSKPVWSGMREVVPARTSLTLHPPSPPIVL